ncbi:hypothetical protein BZA77DRAFT_292106 [Pyronema omphalodes]|nr:hypothetical protein BZA77DRAFT_292106 [Pyronema omphalodes]
MEKMLFFAGILLQRRNTFCDPGIPSLWEPLTTRKRVIYQCTLHSFTESNITKSQNGASTHRSQQFQPISTGNDLIAYTTHQVIATYRHPPTESSEFAERKPLQTIRSVGLTPSWSRSRCNLHSVWRSQ